MGVAIYARVSTDEQTVEQQILACRKYCEFKGLEVDIVVEESASGKDVIKRPKFRELWDKLRGMEYEGIVVFKIDRLGRNVRDMVIFFDEMQNRGIQIHSITESLDNSTPIGRAMINILLTMAQLERENISLATKQRLQALKNMGKTLGRPHGSKDVKKRNTSKYKGNRNALRNNLKK